MKLKAYFLLLLLAAASSGCRNEAGKTAALQPSPSTVPSAPTTPTQPTSPTTPLTFPKDQRLALGGNHSCFIDHDEKLWCWGSNDLGEIGNGKHGWQGRSEDTDEEARVVQHPFSDYPFTHAQAVAATGGATCAITGTSLWCWGGLGPKPMQVLDRPVLRSDVPGPIDQVAISAHTCAIGQAKLYCWGNNQSAAVGMDERLETTPPRVVEAMGAGVLSVATSMTTTCAVRADRTVWCWGGNDFAERGEPKAEANPRPHQVPDLSAVGIYAGAYHFCALSEDHAARCWGQGNHYQLGNRERVLNGAAKPQTVQPSPGIVQLAANAGNTLAVLADGTVRGWGENFHGLLGVADRALQTPEPKPIPGLDRVVQVAVGSMHACALREDETVWCWGQGDDYQLGNGKNEDSLVPVQVVLAK